MLPASLIYFIFIELHPRTATYTFFLGAHEIFTKMVEILDYNTHIDQYIIMEIIQSMFFDYTGIILKTNDKKKTRKSLNT